MRCAAIVVSCVTIACGGKHPPAQQHGDEHAPAEHHGDEHHHALPPELGRFHDELAPRWHAEKGPDRVKSTCDAIPEFRSRADAVAKAAPPSSATGDAWTAGTKQLVDSVAALDAKCRANDATAFDSAFAQVHESFEALAESAMHAP
jgi:hypothetical protein